MGFNIGSGILTAYPEIKIGVLVCRDVKVNGTNSYLEDLKGKFVMEAAEKIGSDPVTKIPFISSWREMYRSFGTKPGDYRPSAEALLRRTVKRRALPRINTAVDAYNTMSIKHLIPMGGFDLDRIQGGISLRFSPGGEGFLPLGASEMEGTYEGEPVYADEARVLTRRWNYRDCDETKITLETRNMVMFVDGSGEMSRASVEDALQDLSGLLRDVCGGDYFTMITGVNNASFSF